MKVLISINFICYDYVGQNKYKLFITKENSVPYEELLDSDTLNTCLHRLTTKYFETNPEWVLQYLSLVGVSKHDHLLIEYSCLVPELASKEGRFIRASDLGNLAHILNSLKV